MNFVGPSQSSTRGLFAEIVGLQQAGRRAVLATPLWWRSSVPLSYESRLLYRDDGSTQGTIGGGALEAKVIAEAPQVLKEDRLRVLEFDLSPSQAAEAGMICGGRCAVLLEPLAPDRGGEVFAVAAEAEAAGRPIVLITLLPADGGTQRLAVTAAGDLVGTAGDSALDDALRGLAWESRGEERPRLVEEPVRAQIAPILPHPSLFIFGAGHIGVVLAHVADLAGFRVVVTDDREEFANPSRFPRADEVLVGTVPDVFPQLEIGEESYVVAVTRGHAMDEEVVARALRTQARYIGMIGSKRKVAAVLRRLRDRGFSDDELARLHAPIGLDIGAETVAEIAVSIVAELVELRRQGG